MRYKFPKVAGNWIAGKKTKNRSIRNGLTKLPDGPTDSASYQEFCSPTNRVCHNPQQAESILSLFFALFHLALSSGSFVRTAYLLSPGLALSLLATLHS
jgi:hypothetical protein